MLEKVLSFKTNPLENILVKIRLFMGFSERLCIRLRNVQDISSRGGREINYSKQMG